MLQRYPILRLLRRTLLTLIALYLAGTVFGGIALSWIAVHPPRRTITTREEANARASAAVESGTFVDASIATPDGAKLSAWFLQPESGNGDVVILLHGVSDNRMGMYGYGKWLLSQHYAVLLPDARAHGLSSGLATYGLKESDDIHQWVDWLESRYHPRCVYGFGESMGAAQVLQALPKEPRLCAVVAESAFSTFREVAYARFGRAFHTGEWIGRTFFRPSIDVGFLFLRLRYGLKMEEVSPQRAVETTKTPIMLIHGLSDRNIPPYHSDEILAHNPSDIVLWKVPGAVHTGAHKVAPMEFDARVLDWFGSHALDPAGRNSLTTDHPPMSTGH
jgi:dipeptidyl aminopeptidase/acylaminoacyl peptidase